MEFARRLALVLGVLVGGGLVALRADPAGITRFSRAARDPRMSAPGLLVPKVPREGPDPPYAAAVMEVVGAVRALYLRDTAHKVWRIEVPWEAGRPRHRFAVSLIPGAYEWVGFSHWRVRRDGRYDVWDVFDVAPVPLEVVAGTVAYLGSVLGSIVERPRLHAVDRSRGTVAIHPLDFDFTFTVADEGPGRLAVLAGVWPWIARRGLGLATALVGATRPRSVAAPLRTLPARTGPEPTPPASTEASAPATGTAGERRVPRAGEKPWRVRPAPVGESWGHRSP